MKELRRTTGTLTAEGTVLHQLHMPSGVMCPVKLEIDVVKPASLHPVKRRDGGRVFALPGGGEVVFA